jgi:hypothetical protein
VFSFTFYRIQADAFDLQRYFIPTQEQFVVQQSQLFKGPEPASLTFGNPPGTAGASGASATAFSFGLGSSSGINTQQFFGGSFGLGFGFGGGWYPQPQQPYPFNPPNVDSFGNGKFTDFNVPTLLRPSDTGWDTSYSKKNLDNLLFIFF